MTVRLPRLQVAFLFSKFANNSLFGNIYEAGETSLLYFSVLTGLLFYYSKAEVK